MCATELTIDLGHGRNLAARCWGDPEGHPTLALHGWLDNCASFDPIAPYLGDTHIVAVDLPGHGLSSHRPPGVWYHLIDYVPDVIAAANALGWDRFSLLGHSLGGSIATLVAAAIPERISSLALIEALGPLPHEPGSAARRLVEGVAALHGQQEGSRRLFPDRASAVSARVGAGDLSRSSAQLLVQRNLAKVSGGYRWRSDSRLTMPSPFRLSEGQVREYLAEIAAPTCVVAAVPSFRHIDPQMMSQRLACVRQMELHKIPGGHHLHMDDPEPVATLLARYLVDPDQRN